MGSPPAWPYGYRKQSGTPEVVWATEEVVAFVLGDWARPLGSLIKQLAYIPIPTDPLCAGPPPEPPEIEIWELVEAVRPFGNSLPVMLKMQAHLARAMWIDYCEYVPAPNPVTEPAPEPESEPIPPPPEELAPVPDPRPIVDNDDLAQRLHAIETMLQRVYALSEWLSYNVQVRATVEGSGGTMSGNGSVAVQAAIGFEVTVLTYPGYHATSPGSPPVIFDLGYVSWGVGGGLTGSHRLTRPIQTVWSDGLECDRFAWELAPGVTASYRPLHPRSVALGEPVNPFLFFGWD